MNHVADCIGAPNKMLAVFGNMAAFPSASALVKLDVKSLDISYLLHPHIT